MSGSGATTPGSAIAPIGDVHSLSPEGERVASEASRERGRSREFTAPPLSPALSPEGERAS